MIIRRFCEQDAPAVSALVTAALFTTNAKDYPLEELEALSRLHTPEEILKKARRNRFYVAEEGDTLLGCGAVGPGDRAEECGLYTVFVHPDRQGQGVGRRIIQALEADPLARRAERAVLHASVTGLPFYLKLGYTFRDGRELPDENRLYLMEKVLRP